MSPFKTLAKGLTISAAVLAIGACDRNRNYTDEELVQKAKEFQEQGKLGPAVIEFKNALQKNPKNSEARWRLGEIYASQGLGEQAENELQRARDLGVDFEALKVAMGQALLLQGLYPRVIAEIEPGPNTPPKNIPKILEIRGRAQHGLLHFKEGCDLFAESIARDPQYVPGHWGVARCAAARGRPDEARIQLQNALKLDEKNTGTWTQIGDLERATKHPAEAEAAYTAALEDKSDNIDALLGRAVINIDSNKLDEASRDVETALRIANNHTMGNQLRGVIQFKQGKLAEAGASFAKALKSQPIYLPAVAWLGLTNLAAKNYEQAARQFTFYMRNVPNAHVQALLGLAQARLGRGEEAEETLQGLRKIDPADSQTLAVLAQAHLTLGETDLAATYLAKAVEKKPDAADLRVSLANALSEKGARTQAIAQLQTAIQLDPGMVDADVMLIQNLIREKQFDKALAAVESLERKQPKSPIPFNLKGEVYLGKNDVANARKSFERALELDPSSGTAATNLARLDLVEANPEPARQRFNNILAKDKTNLSAMMGLAGVAAATGQESEYVAWLEKAARADPSALRPRLLLAGYYLQKKDIQKALTMAQETQTAHPADPQALDLLGSAQFAAAEYQNAAVTYGKLVSAVPGNAAAHYKLATAQIAAQSVDSAKASLNKALALQPDFLEAKILLASAELGTGRYAQALNIAQQIQKQHPDSTTGYVLQGDIQMAQQQFAPALKAYEKALAINSHSGVLAIKVHQALSAGQNSKEADARLIHWLDDHPSDAAARAYLASAYMKTGRNKQAIEQYQALLESDSKNIVALNNLAWLYQQAKDPRALNAAEQAYQLKPDNPQIMDTLGWILAEQGKTARALELLRKAAQQAPTSTSIHYHLAATLAKSGDIAGARRELADLLTNNKQFPERQDAQALLNQL